MKFILVYGNEHETFAETAERKDVAETMLADLLLNEQYDTVDLYYGGYVPYSVKTEIDMSKWRPNNEKCPL